MIDLTPLDVRKKKGDFRRALRGYEPALVDDFLDLVAERMEELVRENLTLKERNLQQSEALARFREREQAMNEALVTAQQMREELRSQATREGEMALKEAQAQAERVLAEAQAQGERVLAEARRQAVGSIEAARRVQRERVQYLRNFRAFVERQLADIEQEEARIREQLRAHDPGPNPEKILGKDEP